MQEGSGRRSNSPKPPYSPSAYTGGLYDGRIPQQLQENLIEMKILSYTSFQSNSDTRTRNVCSSTTYNHRFNFAQQM